MRLTVISRDEAASKGMKRFFTADPCKRFHVSERLVSNGLCIECARLHKKADRERNVERERERSRKRGWNGRKDNRRRPYAPIDPVKRIAYQRKWKKKRSPEQVRKEYDAIALHRKHNPEIRRTSDRNRSARKRSAAGCHSVKDIKALYELQSGKCASCYCCVGFNEKHVDHVMPLALGGGNGPDNLQILCCSCNLRKAAKHPLEWAREIGRLL